jgi:2-amino-4-hydroxy-6-hydroxymethyldihydropteridine diphosphokinase
VARTFLGLGSNLGDRLGHLRNGLRHLDRGDVAVVDVSGVWETQPLGGPHQDPYLNIVAEVRTGLDAVALLARCQAAEVAEGRERHERWGARPLDVDILLIEGLTIDHPDLQVPHPRLWDRRFVLAPLAELAPELVPKVALTEAEGEVHRLGTLGELPVDPTASPRQ